MSHFTTLCFLSLHSNFIAMQINRDLLTKYNAKLPRYTSYPPANYFTKQFTQDHYLMSVEDSNFQHPKAISLYFHIPFCPKICFYCGCNAYQMEKKDTIDAYVSALLTEVDLVAARIDFNRLVTQVHFGGGTPNAVGLTYIKRIMEHVHRKFDFVDNAEIAMECNPAYLTENYVDGLHELGFNRISLGIQDFDTKVTDAVNRESSKLPVQDLVHILKGRDFKVNLDFIYGLPFQTKASFSESILQAVKIRPDRLVTFSYAHVPWAKKNQEKMEQFELPNPELKTDMFEAALNITKDAGYEFVGLDHFTLPEDELTIAVNERKLHRNFQGYCTRETTGQVYAFGVTGISQLNKAYSQNTYSIKEYIESLKNYELPVTKGYLLSADEMLIRDAINEIMCNRAMTWSNLQNHKNAKERLILNNELLLQLQDDDLIEQNKEGIFVTEQGRFFLRNIASAFDANLDVGSKKFSSTV